MEQGTQVKIKLLAAIFAVIASLVLGAYTKVMFVLHFADPVQRWTNMILYAISWIIIFVAAFFVGKEILVLADKWVRKKLCETYDITAKIPMKGIEHSVNATRKIHKKTVKLHKNTIKHGKKQFKKSVDAITEKLKR